MINQLPYDVQLIVFKYIHKHRFNAVFKDMMWQLREELPYLRMPNDDWFKRRNFFDHCQSSSYSGRRCITITVWLNQRVNFYDMSIGNYWQYPYWYFELSDNFIEARYNRAKMIK